MDLNNENFDNYIKDLFEQNQMSFFDSDYKLQAPPMYNLVLEDVSDAPRAFVVNLISSIFHKSKVSALVSAKKFAKEGFLVCAICTRDVAETKITEVTEFSIDNGFKVKFSMKDGK